MKTVTVLVPTWKRLGKLHKCLESIRSTAADNDTVEIMLRVTDADTETLDALPFLIRKYNCGAVVGPRMNGYNSLSEYHDHLIMVSKGEWLWQFNDDVYVEGFGWDMKLRTDYKDMTNLVIVPEVHRLGSSSYLRDKHCPFMFLHRSHWDEVRKTVPMSGALSDCMVWNYADARCMEYVYMDGLKVWHDRDVEDLITENHKI